MNAKRQHRTKYQPSSVITFVNFFDDKWSQMSKIRKRTKNLKWCSFLGKEKEQQQKTKTKSLYGAHFLINCGHFINYNVNIFILCFH